MTSLVGSSASNFYRLARTHKIHGKYRFKFYLSFIVTLILEPFRAWETIRWKKRISRVSIEKPPVFIIGFWRSGTTLLHNLLCQAPDAAYVSTFQTVFPHLTLSHRGWLQHIVNLFLPETRPFDNVKFDMDFPQEEEIAMAHIQEMSFYKFWYFPADFEVFNEHDLFFEGAEKSSLDRWKYEYRKLISKAILNSGGVRFISKNPSNLGRIDTLLELFPDARFIFTYRDPYKALESFYLFAREVYPGVQLQDVPKGEMRERYVHLFNNLIRKYESEKHLIPPGQLIEIRFEDFISDKLGNLRLIYDRLRLDGFDDARPAFEKYIEEIEGYRTSRYDIPPETISMVNEFMLDKLKDWGYDPRQA